MGWGAGGRFSSHPPSRAENTKRPSGSRRALFGSMAGVYQSSPPGGLGKRASRGKRLAPWPTSPPISLRSRFNGSPIPIAPAPCGRRFRRGRPSRPRRPRGDGLSGHRSEGVQDRGRSHRDLGGVPGPGVRHGHLDGLCRAADHRQGGRQGLGSHRARSREGRRRRQGRRRARRNRRHRSAQHHRRRRVARRPPRRLG